MATSGGHLEQSHYRLAQEREFYKYIPNEQSNSRFAPWDQASQSTYSPQPSRDSALTSFAQLGAIRLGTERALISLFDRTSQHVVAESTPSLSLVGGNPRDGHDQLRLGCCVFPKDKGFCHYVESLPSLEYTKDSTVVGHSALIINDLANDERFKPQELVGAFSDVRFYAAVPITSPRGLTIGAYSIMDTKARPSGLDEYSIQFMKDMAATIMDHLAMKHSTFKSHQAERMILGLGSFVEGRSTLRDSWRQARAQYTASENSGETMEGQLDIQQQDIQEAVRDPGHQSLAFRDPPRRAEKKARSPSTNRSQETDIKPGSGIEVSQAGNSVRSVIVGDNPQEELLSSNIKHVFARAANLIRESIQAEGVMFLDANSERFGSLIDKTSRKVTGRDAKDGPESSDESTDSSHSSKRKSSATSQDGDPDNIDVSVCLGFSSSKTSSINDESVTGRAVKVEEPLFSALLRRYPRGKIFTYNANRSVSDDSDEHSQTISEPDPGHQAERRAASKKRRKPTFIQDAANLIKIFPDARNILLLPIWDSDRRRCLAGTLIWTNNPERIFTFENELVFISAFTNSIVAEIRRLDVEAAEKAKTNLVSSITHELRNPLHGILGTADILSDTAMNALQHGMVHTIESCGRTLLDTINNLLDLSFIDKYQRKRPRIAGAQEKKQNGLPASLTEGDRTQGKYRDKKASYVHVKLDSVLEEVTECVFAGYTFYSHPQAPPPALNDSSSRSGGPATTSDQAGPLANQVTIIFDIQPNTEWDFYTHAGAWRRILMNVFGNALKYTPSGYIYLGLKSSQRHTSRASAKSATKSPKEDDEFEVTLTVKDTGQGIGADYLHNGLFKPFTQENSLASGSGLGLSIVRQAVGSLGGSIEINSTKNIGTELIIKTPLVPFTGPVDGSLDISFNSIRNYTHGRTVGLLGFGEDLSSQRDKALFSSLERLCCDWFGLEVASVSPLKGERVPFDFYLAVQTELDSEDTAGRNLFAIGERLAGDNKFTSPVVVICQSPEEAHSMFVEAKNRAKAPIFEFISQPCGPRKLARALDLCIKRRLDQESGHPSSTEPTRWVEMPESSHLPVDLRPSDPPEERMKISKRPTADTMQSPSRHRGYQFPSTYERQGEAGSQIVTQPTSPQEIQESMTTPMPPRPFVLLVDDNDLNLQLLCAYTKKENYEYMTAQNGAEAVDVYKAHPGKFRAVLIDISMPVMDGFEASRQIRRFEKEHRATMTESVRKVSPPTIIAALTGLDSPDAQKEAFGSGIDTFLVKPVKRHELRAILQQMDEQAQTY
ncbi:hypothetical protein FE257_000275 [Aspergillus nanangensis]|uniref:histidine kinase n=1 Tax=Aspergillus nanangensis TaxID=2582783 RepID=A0AAD4CZ28_ASPNN|nr:hypothetical protein FE257_000275 [Aspergillus nanangensis]